MQQSTQSQFSTTRHSVDTTYLVQNNSSLSLGNQLNKSLSELETAVADYRPVIEDIGYVFSLKQRIAAQVLEIETLNAENNELVQRILEAVKRRDDNMFCLSIEYVALHEQHHMLAKLLNAAKKAQKQQEKPEIERLLSQDFEELIYKPFKGKYMTKAQAVGLMGELDRHRHGDYACIYCCGDDSNAALSHGEKGARTYYSGTSTFELPDPDTVAPSSSATNRILSYQARINSLELETRGLQALLAHRIGELEASQMRMSATLAREADRAYFSLEKAYTAKADIMRQAAYAEARLMRLYSDTAVMAAKGATESHKTKKTTDQALRSARREVQMFKLNKQRDLENITRNAEKDGYSELLRCQKRRTELEEKIRELKNSFRLICNRNAFLEAKLHKEGLANGELRQILAYLNGRE